jgi:hypothetical protein
MSMAGRLGGQMNRMRMGGYGTSSALPMSGGMEQQGLSGGLAAMMAPAQAPAAPAMAGMQQTALPKIQRPGFAGFAERFVNPDPSTPGGMLTLGARYAGAAFGDPMSQGLLQMDRDQEREQRQAQQDETQALTARAQLERLTRPQYLQAGRSIVQVDPETGAAVPVYEAPAPEPTSGPLAYLGAMRIDPASPEGRQMLTRAMTGFQYSPEAQQARVSTAGAVADAQGQARARYREPPSAPGGGGAGPVRVSSPQEAMRLPPGTVFLTPDGRRKVR